MRDGIDVLQSLYARSKKTFSDGPPSESLDGSRHIDRRSPERPQSTGREVPSCHKVMDTPSSGRAISSVRPSHRGASKYAPRGSDDHHASPPDVVVEVGAPGPTRGLDQLEEQFRRVTDELRDDLAYERSRRHGLYDTVKDHYNELSHRRSDDRAESAITQLESERTIRSLRDELSAYRQDIAQMREQFALLADQYGSLKRDH